MATRIIEYEKPKLRNPLFIEGLPGVGNVGRIAAGYLVEQLDAKKFAELFSSHFMPFVLLHESSAVHVLKNEFYYWKAKKRGQRDLIILIGDSQSVDSEGHYEIVDAILDFVSKYGVKEIGVFGSYVRGEQREASDVDILVEFTPKNHTFDNFMEVSFLLEELLERKVEVVTPDGLSPHIGPYILKEVERVPIAACTRAGAARSIFRSGRLGDCRLDLHAPGRCPS